MNLRREFEAFRAACTYFTQLPLALAPEAKKSMAVAVTYWPFVGILVGAVAGLTWWLALRLWPPLVASGLSLAATVLLTGGMHEDGWADVCDGFGAGRSKEHVLAIMKDSRIGAFGVIGLVILMGLKWDAIAALPVATVPVLLVAGHALSRSAAATMMATQPYARSTGESSKARLLVTRLRGWRLASVLTVGLAPLMLLPARYCWAAVAVLAVRVGMGRWFRRRIGGYTGDCLGAMQQAGELAFYLAALAVA